ncbi:hypothetical protein [Streptomyces fungicidicus]|uniref:hypothetical protein n=1 Tax=Streptomyces fungicidicus TaxID=68203 RepID=UPI0033F0314F
MRLRDERLDWSLARLHEDLRLAVGDVAADLLVGDLGAVLFDQAVKDRVTVCRCLRGASRSARRIPSTVALYGSSAVARGGSFFLGSGQTESTAFLIVRHDTLYLREISRIVMPSRWSRRIAAYSSTFDICGMTRAFHQEHPDAGLASTPMTSKLVNITRPWFRVTPKLVNN